MAQHLLSSHARAPWLDLDPRGRVTPSNPFSSWGLNYVNPDMLNTLLASGISPEMMSKQFEWNESAEQMETSVRADDARHWHCR